MKNRLVAHRGYSAEYPENTLIAVESALALGACFVEIDVHLTADHVPVVIHDKDLVRTAGQSVNVMEYQYVHLAEYSVHYPSKFGNKFTPQRIASLGSVIGVLKRYPGRKVFVEVKRASISHFGIDTVLDSIMSIVEPLKDQCILISFNAEFLIAAKQKKQCGIGWVLEDWNTLSSSTIENLAPNYLFVDCAEVPQEQGEFPKQLWQWVVYTLDEPQAALQWFVRGADLVETNDFGKLIKHPDLMSCQCNDR